MTLSKYCFLHWQTSYIQNRWPDSIDLLIKSKANQLSQRIKKKKKTADKRPLCLGCGVYEMGFETQYRANSKFRKANDWEVNLWVLHPPISKGLSVCWYVISKINKVCVSVCVYVHRLSACWYVSRFGFLKSKSWDMDLRPNDFEERQFQKALWEDGKVTPRAGMVKSKECTNYHYEKLCFSPSGNPLR